MKKLEITEGRWDLNIFVPLEFNTEDYRAAEVFVDPHQVIAIVRATHTIQGKGNAELIVDAGNTYQQCALLPSELLKQNKELREALGEIQRSATYTKRHSHAHYREQLKEIFDITQQAMKP